MDVKNEKMGGNSWSMTLIKQPACKPYYVPEGKKTAGYTLLNYKIILMSWSVQIRP